MGEMALNQVINRSRGPIMRIINGDHAEFEIENANTRPEDRPDWPLPSFDARDWAREFCRIATAKGFDPINDEDWVVTWFANALMRGYDERESAMTRDDIEVPHPSGNQ